MKKALLRLVLMLLPGLLLACAPLPPPEPPPTPSPSSTPDPSPTPFGLYGQSLLDLTYCTQKGEAQKLDIYFPEQGGPWPVVFYIHGGSWMEGDKSEAAGLATWLNPQGYAVVSINYRFYPYVRFPALIEDVKCALRFLRAHHQDYNLDSERILAMGASAGGHLATLLATSDATAGWDVGEYADQSSRVTAVIAMSGPMDLNAKFTGDLGTVVRMAFYKNLDPASPINQVTADDPPFLLIHGDQDGIVSVAQSQAMYDKLLEVGVPARLVIVQNGGHDLKAWDGSPTVPTMEEINQIVLEFMAEQLK